MEGLGHGPTAQCTTKLISMAPQNDHSTDIYETKNRQLDGMNRTKIPSFSPTPIVSIPLPMSGNLYIYEDPVACHVTWFDWDTGCFNPNYRT